MGCAIIDVEALERLDRVVEIDLHTVAVAMRPETLAIVDGLPGLEIWEDHCGSES